MATLQQHLSLRNWTQTELAIRAGIAHKTVWRIVHGYPVQRTIIEKVLATLDITEQEVDGLVFSKPLEERVNRAFMRRLFLPR